MKGLRKLKNTYTQSCRLKIWVACNMGLLQANSVGTPLEASLKLELSVGKVLSDQTKYRKIVGKLIYLTIMRPNLSYVVSVVSQFMQDLRKPHWDAVLRILWYLKKHPN